MKNCTKCSLHKSRRQTVFGCGNKDSDWLFIAEAPGKDEELKGDPFVGRAGRLLNEIIFSIGLNREDIYIANILKCRPPNNRDPLAEEVHKCEPYLIHQINLIKPKLIVALGRVAAKTLLNNDLSLKEMRSVKHNYYGIPLVATYHPAALLRNQNLKPAAWDDFKWIRNLII